MTNQHSKQGIVVGYEPENKNGLLESEKYKHMKVKPIFDKIKPQQQESRLALGTIMRAVPCGETIWLDDLENMESVQSLLSTERQRVLDEVVGKISEIMSDVEIEALEKNLKIAFGEKQCRVCGYNPRHQKEYLLQALKELEGENVPNK